jgi:hypothetical protein
MLIFGLLLCFSSMISFLLSLYNSDSLVSWGGKESP